MVKEKKIQWEEFFSEHNDRFHWEKILFIPK